ncbi:MULTISPECIES: hypothetical protein [Microbacterium]|uniref:Uncharacterized protein n=1 Tax=Microbacterium saccharophilum TaxID=1213358 RepID=A0A7Z7CZP8_9MICO|nr:MULTISPECIES: hypothetical protein [Microbacterium]SFI76046.1 hypothetical protein SAMN04487751_2895 [Microbacterium saccharophilum]
MVEVFTVALILASGMGIAIMVIAQPWQRGGGEPGLPMTMLAGIGAFSALLSTLGYVIADSSEHPSMPLVIADTTMPLAVGLLWAAMRRGRDVVRSVLPAVIVPSALVGVTTLWVSPDAGQYAKLGVIFVFGALTAWECFRPSTPPSTGRTVVGAAVGAYGVYSLVRLVGTAVLGIDHPLYIAALSTAPSGIVGAVVTAACAYGVTRIAIDESRVRGPKRVLGIRAFRTAAAIRFALASPRSVVLISILDLSLHRTAYGRTWTREVFAALLEAVDAAFPADVVIGRVRPGIFAAMATSFEVDEGVEDDVRALFTEGLDLRGVKYRPDLSVQQVTLRSVAEIVRAARPASRVERLSRSASRP